MRGLLGLLVLVSTLPAMARAAVLRIDVTYTDGRIVSGPLTPDLNILPESVFAFFTLNGLSGELSQVVESSLVFGDTAWSVDDLQGFSATFLPTDSRQLAVTSLTYAYRPKTTATSKDKLAANFPLEIRGVDIASGQEFHYLYDTSIQTVTVVPEPAAISLSASALACFLALLRPLRFHRRLVERPLTTNSQGGVATAAVPIPSDL